MQNDTTCYKYCTGSTYHGKYDDEGKPSGYGCFRFPNGVEYRGQFKGGVFHGRGLLVDKSNFKMCGEFVDGKCVDYELFFADGLKYTENDWKYCENGDRRFWLEVVRGLSPVGETLLTNDKPSRIVPQGLYDAGEGFFDPATGYIYDAVTGAKRRYVCPQEQKYIVENYRMNERDFEKQQERDSLTIHDISTDSLVSDDEWVSIDSQKSIKSSVRKMY